MATTYEVELPAAYLDDLVEDAAPYVVGSIPVLINRDPEPLETQIAKSTNIALDIATLGATGSIDIAQTRVYVDGALAFDGGVFDVAFGGATAGYSNPQADVLRIVLDPQFEFDSEQTVQVRVVSRAVGDINELDETYSFKIEDYVGPRLVKVEAIDLNRVRVTFNENVSISSALDPANWVLDRLGDYVTPIVWAEVVSVEASPAGGPTAVELLTDIPLTPGGTYQLTAQGTEDQAGNPVLAPFNVGLFEGWRPPWPAARQFDLYKKFATLNQAEDDTLDLLRFVGVIQEVANLLLYDIDRFIDIVDPDTAPEPFVDAMLADLGNPFDFELSLMDKRRLANVLVDMYRLKGTEPGIRNVARFFLGLEVSIDAYNTRPGWRLGIDTLGVSTDLLSSVQADLYTFTVGVPERLEASVRKRLMAIVNYMKPCHTHFAALVEPTAPSAPLTDHVVLGESFLGIDWILS